MKTYLQTTFVCLSMLCFISNLSAQQDFKFDHTTAKSISATTFLAGYQSGAFYNGTNGFFYDNTSATEIQPDWFDLDPVDVTAALSWDDDNVLLFSGSNYVIYTISEATLGSEWNLWPGLPDTWNDQLDAATRWSENLLFFFQGNAFLVYDITEEAYMQTGLLTDWEGWPATWTDGVDAAQNLNDGFIYFFNQGQVMHYNLQDATFSSPKNIGTPTLSSGGIPKSKATTGTNGGLARNASRNGLPGNHRQSDNTDTERSSESTPTPASEVVDEYRDDYADHTAELLNDASDWTGLDYPTTAWIGLALV
jgi:hypothetical protein